MIQVTPKSPTSLTRHFCLLFMLFKKHDSYPPTYTLNLSLTPTQTATYVSCCTGFLSLPLVVRRYPLSFTPRGGPGSPRGLQWTCTHRIRLVVCPLVSRYTVSQGVWTDSLTLNPGHDVDSVFRSRFRVKMGTVQYSGTYVVKYRGSDSRKISFVSILSGWSVRTIHCLRVSHNKSVRNRLTGYFLRAYKDSSTTFLT